MRSMATGARLVTGLTTLALAALIAPSSAGACVVGTGSGASCTDEALTACLPGGGSFDATVTFSCGGAATITVSSPKTISAATTVDGGGVTTISGGHSVRVFVVNSGVMFTVRNLTIENGNDANFGSGIENNGNSTVTNCTFSGNTGGEGGALYNGQTLSVTGCTFSGNSATISGGALYNNGTLTLTDSTFSGNTGGDGGAVYNNNTMTNITGCTFSGNMASADGGGIYDNDTLTLTNSTISGNTAAAGGDGGGIYDNGTLTLTNSTISGNTAAAGGDGGGIYNNGTLTLANSTISGNTAATNGDGGGIFNNSDELTVINCTMSGNTAGGTGGGIFMNGDGTLTNTIVAGSSGGNCSTFHPTDGGHNIDDGTTCGFTGTGCSTTTGTSFCNTNPDLDPNGLVNHGGPTETIALLEGSPAVDHGDPGACAAAPVDGVDQRGVSRPAGQCDIGAFEVGALSTTTTVTTTTISTTSTTTTTTTSVTTTTLPGCTASSCVPGSGPNLARSDCYVELNVEGITESNVRSGRVVLCHDGDPCDTDGKINDVCTFKVAVCIDQSNLSACHPPAGLQTLHVSSKLPTAARPSSLEGSACGSFVDVPVKLHRGAQNGKKTGMVLVQANATAAKGTTPRGDRDTYVLECLPNATH